jgi:hypothetical protein
VRPWVRVGWIVLVVAMPLVTLVLIAQEGENVPFHDDWALITFFQLHDDGRLTLADFFSQHNEHRPVFPRAADFLLAFATGWDLRVELYRNFAVAVATFVLLLVALRRTLDRTAFLVAGVVASVLFFSTVNWENWLWGWQLQWFLSNLAAVGALYALSSDRRPRAMLALAVACGVVASFSLGQGLLIWPVGLVVLLLRRRPWIVWACAGAAVVLAYFVGWDDPAYLPSKSSALEHPVDVVRYVALYLGRALGISNATGQLVGAALVVAFAAAAADVLLHRRDRLLVDRAAPWLGIGLYALGAAVTTAVSRVGFGLTAVARYHIMAALFAIATMALLLVSVDRRGPSPATRRRALALITVPLLLAALANVPSGIDAMHRQGAALDTIARCTREARSRTDPCLTTPPRASPFSQQYDWMLYLRSKGWAGY